jgi:hypothetical protein
MQRDLCSQYRRTVFTLSVIGAALGGAMISTVISSVASPVGAARGDGHRAPLADGVKVVEPDAREVGVGQKAPRGRALVAPMQPMLRSPQAGLLPRPGAPRRGALPPDLPGRPTSTNTTTTTSVTHAKQISCPVCAPTKRSVPDVVIPFFERDLCKLKYTAKSISVNDPDHNLGDVYLAWVSLHSVDEFKHDLEEVYESITRTRRVRLIDFSGQITTSAILSGWFGQQLVKLKIASVIPSDYYVVLDAKNTFIKPITANMFFTPCNLAKIQAEYPYDRIPMPHASWYANSAKALNVKKPDHGYWPASITPVVFHRQTVLDMLASIGEDSNLNSLCNGPLCEMLGCKSKDGHGATEFTMYTLYAYQTAKTECIHYVDRMNTFRFNYTTDWQDKLKNKMEEMGYVTEAARANLSVSDGREFPIKHWHFGKAENVPRPDQFPLKFSDLSFRWSASLWRGVKGDHTKLRKVNLETLEDIVKNTHQDPIVFGAQPASLTGMTEEEQKRAMDLLVDIYTEANLFDQAEKSTAELVECVVGWKND